MSKTFGQATRSSKSAKFHNKGSFIAGIIMSAPQEAPVTDIESGKPVLWKSGDPKTQWIFDLLKLKETVCDCDEFCDGGDKNAGYGDEDDDGVRKMYVSSGNQLKAISRAIREAGVRNGEPEVGGTLIVQFTALDKENQKPGRKAPKLYTAQYKRPTDETLAKVRELVKVSPAADSNGEMSGDNLWDLVSDNATETPAPATAPKPEATGKKMSMDDLLSTLSADSE